MLLLLVSVFQGLIVNVQLIPTFKIAVIVQSASWPELLVSNDVLDNSFVRLEVNGKYVIGENVMHVTSQLCELVATDNIDGAILFVDCPTAAVLGQQSIFGTLASMVVVKGFCDIDITNMFYSKQSCIVTNKLISDISGYKTWHNVMLFHDQRFGSRCVVDLLRQLSMRSASTRIVNIQGYNNTEQYLKFLSKYKSDGVIVIGSAKTVLNILQKATSDNLMSTYWIFLTGETQLPLVNTTIIETSKLIFMRQHFPGFISSQGTCADFDSPEMESQAYLSKTKTWFLDVFTKAVSKHNMSSLETLSCRNQNFTPIRSIVMEIATQTKSDLSYQICSTKMNSSESMQHMGNWTLNGGLSLISTKVYENDFVDFGNATLRVAALPLEPYIFFDTDANNKTTYRGFCIDILNQLALKYKFNYEIVSPADNSYGSMNNDGTWNGMVGMVMRKEANFAAGPFTITSARSTVIDFTTTFMEEGVGILTLRPTEEANKEYKVFKPLSSTVWIVISVFIIIVGILLFVINLYSPFSDKNDQEVTKKEKLSTAMWVIYGSFVEEGGDPRPRSASGRIMLSFWWIFTIIMLSTYTANLAAYLTVQYIEPPINSLDELATSDTIKPLIFSGSNLHTLFQTSKSSVYRKIWGKIGNMPEVTEVDIALDLVKRDQYAFMTDYSLLEYIMLKDCHTFALGDEKFNNAGLGFVLQKKCGYLEAFNLAIMRLTEGGFIEQWKNKWWPRSDSCTASDSSTSAQSIGFDSIKGLFYVYFAVVGVAVAFFVLEVLYVNQKFQQLLSLLITKINILKGRILRIGSRT